MLSAADCQTLKTRIDDLETAIHDFSTGNMATEIQTGAERTRFANFSITAARAQLSDLKRQYASGACAVVLGADVTAQAPRRGLKPYFGSS